MKTWKRSEIHWNINLNKFEKPIEKPIKAVETRNIVICNEIGSNRMQTYIQKIIIASYVRTVKTFEYISSR